MAPSWTVGTEFAKRSNRDILTSKRFILRKRRNQVIASNSTSQKGRCLCGRVTFSVSAAPLGVGNCHCRSCQRATGAPFFTEAVFPYEALTIQGDLMQHTSIADSGANAHRAFCPHCGALMIAYGDNPEIVAVSVSAFDDPSPYAPQLDIWLSEAQPWVRLDPNTVKHEKSPKA